MPAILPHSWAGGKRRGPSATCCPHLKNNSVLCLPFFCHLLDFKEPPVVLRMSCYPTPNFISNKRGIWCIFSQVTGHHLSTSCPSRAAFSFQRQTLPLGTRASRIAESAQVKQVRRRPPSSGKSLESQGASWRIQRISCCVWWSSCQGGVRGLHRAPPPRAASLSSHTSISVLTDREVASRFQDLSLCLAGQGHSCSAFSLPARGPAGWSWPWSIQPAHPPLAGLGCVSLQRFLILLSAAALGKGCTQRKLLSSLTQSSAPPPLTPGVSHSILLGREVSSAFRMKIWKISRRQRVQQIKPQEPLTVDRWMVLCHLEGGPGGLLLLAC